MKIELDVVGLIVMGDDEGGFVKVLDDSDATGGFLILVSQNPSMNPAFDSWVADKQAVNQFFEEAGWEISWLHG